MVHKNGNIQMPLVHALVSQETVNPFSPPPPPPPPPLPFSSYMPHSALSNHDFPVRYLPDMANIAKGPGAALIISDACWCLRHPPIPLSVIYGIILYDFFSCTGLTGVTPFAFNLF